MGAMASCASGIMITSLAISGKMVSPLVMMAITFPLRAFISCTLETTLSFCTYLLFPALYQPTAANLKAILRIKKILIF
jgi:hypothetical protein